MKTQASSKFIDSQRLRLHYRDWGNVDAPPLLLVHGSKDEVVEVRHAYKLYDSAGEPKQIIIVDGAEHRLRQNEENPRP